jgi:hypothetical protein
VIQSVALSLRMEVSPLDYAREEGLMAAYGPNSVDPLRRAAGYVAKPGDLPVQNPTQYELVINLKTAKTLGLDVPPTLRARDRPRRAGDAACPWRRGDAVPKISDRWAWNWLMRPVSSSRLPP